MNMFCFKVIRYYKVKAFCAESVKFQKNISVKTAPYYTNRNHGTKLLTDDHGNSEWNSKGTFDFTEIVNSHGLKQGKACPILIFISHFSLKLHKISASER